MATRKRAYIPLPERLAAALACLLPQAQRDDLRARKVSADEVIGLFHNDHIVPHADGGSDAWHNLDPQTTAVHHEKTAKIDIPRIAKGKRLERSEAEHKLALASKLLTPDMPKERPRWRWPKRAFNRGKTAKKPSAPKVLPRRGL